MKKTCQNLEEVRSLVQKLNKTSASKMNFLTYRDLMAVGVRLRRTLRFISLAPSCAHLQWACMVFLNKVGSLDPPFLFEEKESLIPENGADKTQLEAVVTVVYQYYRTPIVLSWADALLF